MAELLHSNHTVFCAVSSQSRLKQEVQFNLVVYLFSYLLICLLVNGFVKIASVISTLKILQFC